jgi:RNA recognition motif-containing protein
MNEQGQLLKLSSGLAFLEFTDPEISLYAVRYLNNLLLAGQRSLIVDFALEDARKMFKRKMKLEKFAKIAEDKRKEARQHRREAKRSESKVQEVVELGSKA